jgi:hypothetical protein
MRIAFRLFLAVVALAAAALAWVVVLLLIRAQL